MIGPVHLCVTTAVHPPPALEQRAQALAAEIGAPYARRRNVNAAQVIRETGAGRLLIVERERLRLRNAASGIEYAFHPNLALVRGLNLMRGQHDLFAEATALRPGDRILDCTLGFAAEATLAALLVGEAGAVVGLESVPELAAVTRDGVAHFTLQTKALCEALRRVRVVTADYREYLPHCATDAFDVVYFDPFFEERLSGSEYSVSPLFVFGNPAPLDPDAVREARRVARRRIVIKHPRHEPLPPVLAAEVSETVGTRKSRVQYDILLPAGG